MKSKKTVIPMGMVHKKHYCHKCAEQLVKYPRTRTVSPGDPDYRRYSRLNHKTHFVGDVEVTEYDLQCPACENIITYDEQCVIGGIQKQLGKNILSEEEIDHNRAAAEKKIAKRGRLVSLCFTLIIVAFLALMLYINLSSGDGSFGFKFYL